MVNLSQHVASATTRKRGGPLGPPFPPGRPTAQLEPVFDRTRSHLRQWPQGARRALEGQQAREG